MSLLLIILSVLAAVVGIIGAIVPGLPGPPISWLALLLLGLSDAADYSPTYLLIFAATAVVITLFDYFVPVWGTRRLGGTRAGAKGSTVGLVVSMFVLPLLGVVIGPMGIVGLLAGPFVGAYVGETLAGNRRQALRAAMGSFVGFLGGTLVKLAFGITVMVLVVRDLIV